MIKYMKIPYYNTHIPVNVTNVLILLNIIIYLSLNCTYYIFPSFYPFRSFYYSICANNFTNIALRTFIHLDFSHILLNMFGIYQLKYIEQQLGSRNYIYKLLQLFGTSSILLMLIYFIIDNECAIGISVILFALSAHYPHDIQLVGYRIDKKYSVFAELAIAQILSDNVSIIGHFVGIMSGFLIRFILNK